jgi:hypothetical protein
MPLLSRAAAPAAGLAAVLCVAIVATPRLHAQQFSGVMVDSHGSESARTPFYVGDGKVRWATTREDSITGAVILDFRRRTMVGLDDQTQQYYTPSGGDPAADLADLFYIMRPSDLQDPCRGWNAALMTDKSEPPHFGCQNLGADTVNGRPATKWQLTYKRSGKTGYAWIDPHLHYLVKMQDPAAQTTMQVREVKEGPQPTSLFAIPAGYTKMDPPAPPRPMHP